MPVSQSVSPPGSTKSRRWSLPGAAIIAGAVLCTSLLAGGVSSASLAAPVVDDSGVICSTPVRSDSLWTEFDHRLSAHMEAEERFVLPAFAHVDRTEALALIREHGDIRALMLELGVAVDLHQLRFEKARDLVDLLRSHSGREDNLLYRWADQNLEVALVERAIAHAG